MKISGKPDDFIKKELSTLRDDNMLSPDLVFKSPYFLEFTRLKGMYSEKNLEDSLIAHLEQFIIELGNGFSFVARQKRMIIDVPQTILTRTRTTPDRITAASQT